MMKQFIYLILLFTFSSTYAQYGNQQVEIPIPPDTKPLSSNPDNADFPRIFPDNSVLFKYYAPQANSMEVSLLKNYEMEKDENGIWSVTTGPLDPGFHYYSYIIDGVSVSDPASKAYFGYNRYMSGIEVPEKGLDFYDFKNVPHGEIRSISYYSDNLNSWRSLNIYVPFEYARNDKSYPVLYLQHGGGENEESWVVQGKVASIMDNLIAEGKVKEMLVVMSDGRLPNTAYSQIGMDNFKIELIDHIIPFIEEIYRVVPSAEYRALAGLSMGGGQAFYVGLGNPDVFSSVGIFSSGIFGGIPTISSFNAENEIPGIYSDTENFNSSFELIYISCGETDQRIEATRKIIDEFREKGVQVTFSHFSGDHEWQVWRKSLHDFAQRIFK